MLTWPCVTMEWKTPDIHTVEVSDDSSGTRACPVRRIWPCGRWVRASLARSTTWAFSPQKNESNSPPSRSSWRRSAPKSRSSSASSRSRHSSMGAVANSVPPPGRSSSPAGLEGGRSSEAAHASAASTAERSSAEVASG